MRDMAHSICLIKLYQITMRKKFRFFVSGYLKQALRNFEETEKTRINKRSDDNSVLKAKADYPKAKSFNCYSFGLVGHKAADCRKPKEERWCYYCKSTTRTQTKYAVN